MNQKRELTSVQSMTRTCIERARHASLLSELVDGGLQRKLQTLQVQRPFAFTLTLKRPDVKINSSEWKNFNSNGCLGDIRFKNETTFICNGSEEDCSQNSGARYYRGIFKTWDEDLKGILEITLPGYCKKLSLINGNNTDFLKRWYSDENHCSQW